MVLAPVHLPVRLPCVQVPPEARAPIAAALAAHARVAEAALLAQLFRVAMTKYAKVWVGGSATAACVCCCSPLAGTDQNTTVTITAVYSFVCHLTELFVCYLLRCCLNTALHAQVMADAASEVPPADMIMDGGDCPEERAGAFLELAQCLAAGLPDAALDPLFAVRDAAAAAVGHLLLRC